MTSTKRERMVLTAERVSQQTSTPIGSTPKGSSETIHNAFEGLFTPFRKRDRSYSNTHPILHYLLKLASYSFCVLRVVLSFFILVLYLLFSVCIVTRTLVLGCVQNNVLFQLNRKTLESLYSRYANCKKRLLEVLFM